MSGPEPDPDSVWTRGVFDCVRNVWYRDDEQAGWHGEVWLDGHTVAVPDRPGAARFVHCHGSDGPSTATFPARAAAMAACEQAGTFTDA